MTSLADIKLVVFDIDGVLTDGKLWYGAEGELVKAFHVRDGVALKLLPRLGVQVAVITAKDSQPLARRMQDLAVEHFYPASHNKAEVLENLLNKLDISYQQVAYVGDDTIDLPAMEKVGLTLAPADGHDVVRSVVDMVAPVKGGEGVARWVCDEYLKATNQYPQAYGIATTEKFERNQL
ncbi:KdsC family phosphatase [Salinibius halmophilus]|uniref:KdsC family phosphatase n=1 Tax=Salinibius halmophilus TaxID=1853216 RepID=UPI000E6668D0|nr:HAD-IIIA family hydrolase [Salinibius halmophilus]